MIRGLVTALGDEKYYVRLSASEALAEIGDKAATSEVIRALLTALGDAHADVRRGACKALWNIGDKAATSEVIRALVTALGDESKEVRSSACEALVAFGEKASINDSMIGLKYLLSVDRFCLKKKYPRLKFQSNSTDEMELTKIQDIKNTRISIRLPDILDVLKVECEALNDIQTRVCFRLKDNTYMVKPGIVAGVEDFVETLRAKDREYLKKIEQQRKKSQREANNDKSANINQTPPSQPLTANSSAGSSLALLSTDNSPSTPTKALLSINDCKQSINEFIEKWCKSHTPGILLHESNDYTLFVKESNVHLKCNCGIEMTLPFQRKTKTFQISSFYRHIKQTNCSVIKQKQNTNEQRTTNVQTKDDDQSDIATVVEDVDNSQTHHLDLKRRACFIYPNTNEYVVRPGIKYNIEYVTELLRRFQQNFDKLNNNDTNLFKTTTTCLQANEQPATLLKNLNDFVNNSREQNEHQPFLFAFLENIINNLGRSKNNYEYNEYVHRFAITLHILAGSNTYEFIRINLPGALPSVSTLEQHNKNIDLKMNECQFQFDRLKGHLDTINSNFVFLSEDCSSVVNIVRSAYGADTKLVAIDILRRWIYIYEQCKLNDIRIIGYSTDCDSKYLKAVRLTNGFFSRLPNINLIDIYHADLFEIDPPHKWNHGFIWTEIIVSLLSRWNTFGNKNS
ncbi:unnamed protein product [Didymodactylos carnosus]|uniref:THAP9-like helix-turn-helix domain-containing protein n=1 Tax=Didymodactylos carnosus TaxID=1234261 RepID=A0A8S2KDR4_9BILA|nr:unnamed protein product [Didymodactylos carnosus]CAF3845623.1 unnamed protein product [Didymodactylos carnosus]